MHGAHDGEDDEGGEEVVGLVVEQVLRDAVQPPLLVVQVRDLDVNNSVKLSKGRCTNDVCSGRGEGVGQFLTKGREVA